MALVGQALLKAFQQCDRRGDGYMSRTIAEDVMVRVGITAVDAKQLLDSVSSERAGEIRYGYLLTWLFPSPSPAAIASTDRSFKFFVGANWKCGMEKAGDVDSFVSDLNTQWLSSSLALTDIEVCLFSPYVFLERARRQLISELSVGSQNAWDAAPGFTSTGVVTADMLNSIGCRWVLLGHSDRRNILGESDALIAEKMARCLTAGLSVNLTIGETREAREAGEALDVLLRQLGAAAAGVPSDAWARVVVAYEPVWAVGEGAEPCSPDEAQRIHAALRRWIQEHVGNGAARACRLVYTGSVNETNAEQYARLPDVDGFVVGRAGLEAKRLVSVCETLANCKVAVKITPSPPKVAQSRKFFIGANWKCSVQATSAVDELVEQLNQKWLRADDELLANVEVCVFPPYIFLDRVRRTLSGHFCVGSQNAWDAAPGFTSTGVVTADMLKSIGCRWVLLGHSDRRNELGESDDLVAEKTAKCLANGLGVNLTIGESAAARAAGDEEALEVLRRQLRPVVAKVAIEHWDRVVLAYEPVWAIGDGATPCSPDETQKVLGNLRVWLTEQIGDEAAMRCRFVYTGSVNAENAASYASLPDVDGFVVGRAGLDASKLLAICETLADAKHGAE